MIALFKKTWDAFNVKQAPIIKFGCTAEEPIYPIPKTRSKHLTKLDGFINRWGKMED